MAPPINYTNSTVTADSMYSASVSIVLAGESDFLSSTTEVPAISGVTVGSSATPEVFTTNSTVQVPAIERVTTTSIATPTNPTQLPYIPEIYPLYSETFFIEEEEEHPDDVATVNILTKLTDVKNNVTKLPAKEKSEWSQNILSSISRSSIKNLLSVYTANYDKLGKVRNRIASRK